MASFFFFWILATLSLLKVATANSSPPVPVLKFQDIIVEGEDTDITCTLPCTNCLDVDLIINANTTLKNCNANKGNNPNVTCTIEVTQEVHDMEFTCEAQFKVKSLPKKMTISKTTENGGRREPVLATILAILVAASLLHYLC